MRRKQILALTFFIYFLVFVLNDGFMALDEYWDGVTRYIPAQSSDFMSLVAPDDVKSPLQIMPMHAVAQLALSLGVKSPYGQYRSVIFVLGLISILLLVFCFIKFSEVCKFSQNESHFLLLMLAFYFAAPFALTRPMFEAVASPWLTLAAVLALRYDFNEKISDLLLGVFFVSIAFILRQQLGFCALVFIILPALKKNLKHIIWAGALGLIFFVLAGMPDYFMRGKFHYSLINLTVYNYEHGSEYGNRSVFFYPVLICITAFTPFFVKKYPVNFTKNYIKKYRSLLMIVGLFIFLHSLFPQKWERFVVSIIPILIFLVFPFLYYLQQNFKQHKIRLVSLYSLNGFLFIIASFFPAQKNLIEMSRYLDQHPEIKKVYRVNNTPEWITEVFILDKNFQFINADNLKLTELDWSDCSHTLILSETDVSRYTELTGRLKLNAVFNVNLIEQLAFKANPKNNLRRIKLSLYSGCER